MPSTTRTLSHPYAIMRCQHKRLFVKINFNYSVILNPLIPCIGETVEEVYTASLVTIEYLDKLYMSRLDQLGAVLESIQLEFMLTHFLTAAQERNRHPACTLTVIWLI